MISFASMACGFSPSAQRAINVRQAAPVRFVAGNRFKSLGERSPLITGERKFEKEEKSRKYHRVERSFGRFERSFVLPEGAKSEAVTADYKDGVLKVHLPKVEHVEPKALEIKVA